jgi:mRNA interferase MazF
MGRFVKGDVIVTSFPYSDLSSSKRRPALVVASLEGDDLILCAISSQARSDEPFAIEIKKEDFAAGALTRTSYVRCDHIFTGDSSIVEYRVGTLNRDKVVNVIDTIVKLLREDDSQT